MNKVSYRNQIGLHHSGHQGPWSTVINNFLTSSLITMQNLVAVSHAVCTRVGSPKNLGDGRAPPDPLEACSRSHVFNLWYRIWLL